MQLHNFHHRYVRYLVAEAQVWSCLCAPHTIYCTPSSHHRNLSTMIATLASLMESHSSEKPFKKGSQKSQSVLLLVYVVFLTVAGYVYHVIADRAFSSLLTLSAVFQCLAFSLLGVQIIGSDSVAGISAKSLLLDAFALASRLVATVFEVSYVPIDQTGDWIYQAIDGLSLAMVLWLLYRVFVA